MVFSLFRKSNNDKVIPARPAAKPAKPNAAGAKPVPEATAPVAGEAVAEEFQAPLLPPEEFEKRPDSDAKPDLPPLEFEDDGLDSLDFSGLTVEEVAVGGGGSLGADDPAYAVIEQVAVLYSSNQDDVARATLEDQIRYFRQGQGAERLWAMLFDLYQLAGRRDDFERLCLEYTQTFEQSPPSWIESDPVVTVGGVPAIAFRGDLSVDNRDSFGPVEAAIDAGQEVLVDLSRVSTVDPAGCTYLLELLAKATKRRVKARLCGGEGLAERLSARCIMGEKRDEGCWLLLLELLQQQGRQDHFEERAVDYAVTFEVSPPSWDPSRAGEEGACALPTLEAEVVGDGSYHVSGEILGGQFGGLAEYADSADPVVIDCSDLRRVDFNSAGQLLNLLSVPARGGKRVVLRNANRLVAELLYMVGLATVAEIPRRK